MNNEYTYIMLVNDLAELCNKTDSNLNADSLSAEQKQGLVGLVLTRITPFLVGRYNMTFQNAEDVLLKFIEVIKAEPKQFSEDVFKAYKSNTTNVH